MSEDIKVDTLHDGYMRFSGGRISALDLIGNDDARFIVGENCSKITVMAVEGQGAYVPWFRIWLGDEVRCIWNATNVSGVTYFLDGEG